MSKEFSFVSDSIMSCNNLEDLRKLGWSKDTISEADFVCIDGVSKIIFKQLQVIGYCRENGMDDVEILNLLDYANKLALNISNDIEKSRNK